MLYVIAPNYTDGKENGTFWVLEAEPQTQAQVNRLLAHMKIGQGYKDVYYTKTHEEMCQLMRDGKIGKGCYTEEYYNTLKERFK